MGEYPLTLMYHGVVPAVPGWHCQQLGVVYQEDFKRQMNWLNRYYRVLHPQSVIEILEDGKSFPARSVLVTFDDGLQNLLDYALPVLESLGIVPLAFINTQHLDGGDWLWFNRYFASLLRQNRRWYLPQIERDDLAHINQWLSEMQAPRRDETIPLHNQLFDGARSDDLRAAVARGALVIGGHTTHHPRLPAETETDAMWDIQQNKQDLEQLVGQHLRLFAYPEGRYNEKSFRQIQQAGYIGAFAVVPNEPPVSGSEQYAIPRTGIYHGGMLRFVLKCLQVDKLKRRITYVARMASIRRG